MITLALILGTREFEVQILNTIRISLNRDLLDLHVLVAGSV